MTIDPPVLRSKRKSKVLQQIYCRLVCKTWRKLLRHPSFAHVHSNQLSQVNGSSVIGGKAGFGFLFCFAFWPKCNTELYYGEYDGQSKKKLIRINQPPIIHQQIVRACHGLICFSSFSNVGGSNVHESTYISNPVTREYITFPKLEIVGEHKIDTVLCGFGYHSSIQNYKIVRIYYIQNQPLGRVQVYTLGGGSSGWRDLGETVYSLRHSKLCLRGDRSPFGVLANGALHWLDTEQKIGSFDLVAENLYLLPSPPFVSDTSVTNCFQLQVLGGCLCFVHLKPDKFLDIWLLRKKGESSSSDVNVQDYDSLTWIKEFSIPIMGDAAEPFSLTEVVKCYCGTSLLSVMIKKLQPSISFWVALFWMALVIVQFLIQAAFFR
ncbi:F-box/kelch-repeat protein At3g23880-like [Papaver somniferum]|uniref:F-box/kelch-repeat protein At3g23880-like n=1 Tax=Papaver somniferum TaxID=3469 RepID=UPI000E6FBE15|nr:F-box/kelch-repeat protein At3g23880-like [Papaver somniferum]